MHLENMETLVQKKTNAFRKIARRSCVREDYYTRMIRYNLAREYSTPKPKKTKWGESAVFL